MLKHLTRYVVTESFYYIESHRTLEEGEEVIMTAEEAERFKGKIRATTVDSVRMKRG